MAMKVEDRLQGRKDAAADLLREVMDTPFLIELDFTLHVGRNEPEMAEYTIRRWVGLPDDNGED